MVIGGLNIADNSLHFISLQRGRLVKAAVSLAPNIFKNGVVQDREQLIYAFRKLHAQIPHLSEPVPIILTSFPANVLAQSFSIPGFLDQESIEESVKVNLEMLTPWDLRETYCDAQQLKGVSASGQLDFLGAFVPAYLVDDLVNCLSEANFNAVAVEFPALSLSRLVRQWGTGLDFTNNYLLLDLAEEGFVLCILIGGDPYFSRFVAWETVFEERDDHREAILKEVRQTLDYYSNRFGGELKNLIVTPNISTEFLSIIQQAFKFKIKKLGLKMFPDLKPMWFSALGAHLRGLMPRSDDVLVSLSAVGTELQYFRSFISHFIAKWRNWILGGLAGILFVFLIADNILLRVEQSLKSELQETLSRQAVEDLALHEERAVHFNQLVSRAQFLEERIFHWSPSLARLNNLAGPAVIFDKISVTADRISPEEIQYNVVILGRGDSEVAIIDFKNKLLNDPHFENVNLPLSSIVTGTDKKAVFTLNFQVKDFKF